MDNIKINHSETHCDVTVLNDSGIHYSGSTEFPGYITTG